MKKFTLFQSALGFSLSVGFISASFGQVASVTLKDGLGVPLGIHNSITSAYAAIPATLTQAYFIELESTYTGANETYPIVFTAKAGASASNTITLRPSATVTSVSIAGVAASVALLELNDADFIIIDGRPGGVGTTKALTIDNQGTTTTTYGIELINGACNNIFRYFNVGGYNFGTGGGKGIYISTSASNISGNSDNTFEFLKIDGPRTCINSSGTALNKNNNLTVFGCEFVNIHFAGWWQQNGNGKVTIDSCFFYGNGSSGTTGTGVFGILSDFQLDTIQVTRNHIYNLDNFTNTTDVFGMSFRSFNAGAVLRVYNNMISLMATNSSSDEVHGIVLGFVSANNPVDAQISFNTVRIGGVATGGTSGNVGSSAFFLDATNAGSTITGRNNILINERTGGVEEHLAVNLVTTNGTILSDYNRFYHVGNFGKIATTTFPTLASMQVVVSPNEINSDTGYVNFVSNTDLHLAGASIGDLSLAGVQFAGINTDYDGDARVLPYKGSDEVFSAPPFVCSGAPLSNDVYSSDDTLCVGDSILLAVQWNSADSASYLDVYWQSGSDGVTYSNIVGATNDTLVEFPATTTYYRYIVKCAASNDSTISDSVRIEVIQFPVAGSIGANYSLGSGWTFDLPAAQHVNSYMWNVQGDTTSFTGDTLSYLFSFGGIYTIQVIVQNECGSDTADTTIQDYTGMLENTRTEVRLFPNPAQSFVTINADLGRGSIRIYSITGALLIEEALQSGQNNISVESLPNGLYLVEIKGMEGTAAGRLEILR